MPPSEATSPMPEDVRSTNPLLARSQGSAPAKVRDEQVFQTRSVDLYFGDSRPFACICIHSRFQTLQIADHMEVLFSGELSLLVHPELKALVEALGVGIGYIHQETDA